MTLSALIRKRDTGNLATAIPAIPATQPSGEAVSVARIATVAVANLKEEKTAPPAKVDAGDMAIASRAWLLHYPDREPVRCHVTPAATHAEILAANPDALAAEPIRERAHREPVGPLSAEDEAALRAWLAGIGEADAATIAEVIEQCRTGRAARAYFLGRAAAAGTDPQPDDRRTCRQCANRAHNGACMAALRGEITASRSYTPVPDLPRRCEGYAPGPEDADRRAGRERWPGLIWEGVE